VIRVLIAEDMHLIRGALVALLAFEDDIDLPGMDGVTAAEHLHQ
jgi:DNA-binding NarL/FixJ family response regulator